MRSSRSLRLLRSRGRPRGKRWRTEWSPSVNRMALEKRGVSFFFGVRSYWVHISMPVRRARNTERPKLRRVQRSPYEVDNKFTTIDDISQPSICKYLQYPVTTTARHQTGRHRLTKDSAQYIPSSTDTADARISTKVQLPDRVFGQSLHELIYPRMGK